MLPAERPRYLMGVGTPDDLLEAVARGMDMFDCVLPTRNGRHGLAFTRFGPINLRNARHAADPRPLDEQSGCAAARDYSRAYLHHLVKANEMLGAMLLSQSTWLITRTLMAGMREAIAARPVRKFPQRNQGRLGAGRPPGVIVLGNSPRRRSLRRRIESEQAADSAGASRDMPMAINLKVNGASRTITAEPDTPLLYILRNDLGLNGAKFGCGLAQCGACTVLVDGKPMRSCMTEIGDVDPPTSSPWRVSAPPRSRIRCSAPSSRSRRCSAAIASTA